MTIPGNSPPVEGDDELGYLDELFGWDEDEKSPASAPTPPPAGSVLGVPVITNPAELDPADIRPIIPAAPHGAYLQAAKDRVVTGAATKDGVPCPCCTGLVKVYPRAFSKGMGRALMWLVNTSGRNREWVYKSEAAPKWILRMGGDFAKLEKWQLIERMASADASRAPGSSGYWRPTDRGVEFASNRLELPDKLFLLNNIVVGESPTRVRITDRLPDGFDYRELWT